MRAFVKHARDEGVDFVDAYVVKYQGEAWATLEMRASELPRFYDG